MFDMLKHNLRDFVCSNGGQARPLTMRSPAVYDPGGSNPPISSVESVTLLPKLITRIR